MNELTHDQQPQGWSQGAAGYESAFAPFSDLYAADALSLLGLKAGDRFLDVSAGTGATALPAARLGAEVTAVDFAPGMVALLSERMRAEGLQARVEEMDGQSLQLPDGYFDASSSMFGLIFFPDLGAGMSELGRVTRPGGRVLVGAWEMGRFPLFEAMSRSMASLRPGPPDRAQVVPVSMRLGSRDALERAFTDAGLTDIHVHQVTHTWKMDDPAGFFASAPDWSPPLQPIMNALPEAALTRAREAFVEAVKDMSHATGGLETSALLAVGRRV